MVVDVMVCCEVFFYGRVVIGQVFFCSVMHESCRASDVIFATGFARELINGVSL